jgi:hypothetical protein
LNNEAIRAEHRKQIERDDQDPVVFLAKDVHSLLSYQRILATMDFRALVITRDTTRVLDSYLAPGDLNRDYLTSEYPYIGSVASGKNRGTPLLDAALDAIPPSLRRYFVRPRVLTQSAFRVAATIELLRNYLILWAGSDQRIMHVSYEELCRSPVDRACTLYRFLEMDYTPETLSRVSEMTTGSSTDYYATDKDSKVIVNQSYRVLSESKLRALREFLQS